LVKLTFQYSVSYSWHFTAFLRINLTIADFKVYVQLPRHHSRVRLKQTRVPHKTERANNIYFESSLKVPWTLLSTRRQPNSGRGFAILFCVP